MIGWASASIRPPCQGVYAVVMDATPHGCRYKQRVAAIAWWTGDAWHTGVTYPHEVVAWMRLPDMDNIPDNIIRHKMSCQDNPTSMSGVVARCRHCGHESEL